MERDDLMANAPPSAGLNADTVDQLTDYAGIGLFNLNLRTGEILLNRSITLLTGYEPGDLPHTKRTKEMLTFEEDRPLVNRVMASIMCGETDRYQIEYRMRRRDGSIVHIQESAIVTERDIDGRPLRMAASAVDLSRLNWAEDKARRVEAELKRATSADGNDRLAEQNRLLRAANIAGAMIIGGFHQNYETVLKQAIQILTESLGADRATIWRNVNEDGVLHCFMRAGWCKYRSETPSSPENAIPYEDITRSWRALFVDGSSMRLNAADLAPSLKCALDLNEAQSVMLVPLYLHGDFWGFVLFEQQDAPRAFAKEEAEIMGMGMLVIASSITRNEVFSKLNQSRMAAVASTRAKGDFLSRMSHEIRTPMNAIIGMTTIAQRTDDPEKLRYCLEKVDASSRQLLSIINDVLDMSKIEANKFEISLKPFNFEDMIANVLNVVQVKLEEQHQSLGFDSDQVFTHLMVSDELRLSQVLINLMGNATKFTPKGGLIKLIVRSKPLTDGRTRLHVEVVDNGIGIEPEKQAKLFESFEQADGSISRQYGGTGLGLSICKKIVGLMGGDIWVESEPGKGSSFIFEIDVTWGDVIPERAQPVAPSEDLNILVVDDSADVLTYFHNILASFKLSCFTAATGGDSIEAVKRSIKAGKPYDLVFMDWNLPDMNGGQAAEIIRPMLKEGAIVVMISVSDWSDIEPEAKGFGVEHFLSKPVLPSTLYNTIVDLTQHTLMSRASKGTDAQKADWRGKTILLAEDIEINREIVLTILGDTCVTIDCAENGQQALDMFAAAPDRYDLILMDVQMPGMDGLTATRMIRALDIPRAKEVPIIAMTANAFKEDEQSSLDAGMNGHLAKPLDIDLVFKVLSRYLNP